MTQEEKTTIEGRIVDVLRTVFDPEIPVNIYDLGLIYRIELHDDGTLVRQKVESVEGVTSANVQLVFEPIWDMSMMSEEARLELGYD